MKIRTYTQLEAILHTAFDVEGNSIRDVAAMANINLNKWNLSKAASSEIHIQYVRWQGRNGHDEIQGQYAERRD